MITPEEIRQKAVTRYPDFLRAFVNGVPFFPLEIRFGKAKASENYLTLRQWVGALLAESKAEQGYGYLVELEERELRRYGRQSLPARITIENQADYLKLIGKEVEFAQFAQAIARSLEQLPQLHGWLSRYPQRVLPHLSTWQELMAVCTYFLAHPRPNLYIRELPINIHTKFIEENYRILRELLDELLPADAIRADENHFERRFFLRYDEPLVRIRLLDGRLRSAWHWPATDLSLPLSAFASLGLNGHPVLIVENKMTFLTLPPIADAIAIWGSGFQVGVLKGIDWLINAPIWYWGDLDAHGFAILSQVRSYFPHTRSFMMDIATLEAFRPLIVTGTLTNHALLPNLTEEETATYNQLVAENWRLEQEKISQAYVLSYLARHFVMEKVIGF